MVDAHRVAGGVLQAADHADVLAGEGGGGEDERLEVVAADGLRAREGEEQPAGTDFLHRLAVDVAVALDALLLHAVVLGEGGRVEDDEVVMVVGHPVEVGEHVLADGVVPFREVAAHKPHVLLHKVDGLLRNIDGIHMLRPAVQGVQREAAGVGEHVEDSAPFCQLAHHGAALALVEEEAGLLSVEDVDFEEDAVLGGDDLPVGLAVNPADFRCNLLVLSGLDGGFEADGLRVGQQLGEQLREGSAQSVHAHGVHLHDEVSVVGVDDETGHAVALAVDEAEHVGLRVRQQDGLAELNGVQQLAAPEVAVDVVLLEAENAHGDGGGLVVSGGEVLALRVIDFHDVAVAQVFVFAGDGAGEDPRVPPLQGFLLAGAQDDAGKGMVIHAAKIRFFRVGLGRRDNYSFLFKSRTIQIKRHKMTRSLMISAIAKLLICEV